MRRKICPSFKNFTSRGRCITQRSGNNEKKNLPFMIKILSKIKMKGIISLIFFIL